MYAVRREQEKNHFVSKQFKSGDAIVDFDRIYDAITGQGIHIDHNPESIRVISQTRLALLDELMCVRKSGTVWVIMCIPEGRRREFTARRLRNAKTYLIIPGLEKCIERICKDETIEGLQEYRKEAAREWHKNYSPSARDIIIKE